MTVARIHIYGTVTLTVGQSRRINAYIDILFGPHFSADRWFRKEQIWVRWEWNGTGDRIAGADWIR